MSHRRREERYAAGFWKTGSVVREFDAMVATAIKNTHKRSRTMTQSRAGDG